MKDYIRFLYDYNNWANQRVLDTCAQLTQEEFLRGEGSSTANPSIRDTLVHTMGAHEIWLARWGGVSPTRRLDPKDFGTPALISEYWAQIEEHTQGFVSAVEDDVLQAVMHYKNTAGEAFAYPMWWTLVHQVNHATQHRSEVALLLTRANHSPGELDVLGYAHELKPA
jgi:uncharacterized damage-inducible protein DinB